MFLSYGSLKKKFVNKPGILCVLNTQQWDYKVRVVVALICSGNNVDKGFSADDIK